MGIDLLFQKIKFRRQIFIFQFLFPGFKFKPVLGKPKHADKNDNEETAGHRLHDKRCAIKVPILVGITINQVALQVNPEKHDNNKRNKKFKQVTPHFFPLHEPWQKEKIVHIRHHHMEGYLNPGLKESLSKIGFPMAKGRYLIHKKRQVDTPKRKVQQQYPLTLKKRLHLSILTFKIRYSRLQSSQVYVSSLSTRSWAFPRRASTYFDNPASSIFFNASLCRSSLSSRVMTLPPVLLMAHASQIVE